MKKNNKIIIGVCGTSGSGKSYVCECFEKFGGLHIDTDAVYHELLEPENGKKSGCVIEIETNFGNTVIENNTLNRKRLADIVFNNPEKLLLLNSITHKYILDRCMEMIDSSDADFCVVDAPLLFESGFDRLCDYTVCVSAAYEDCITRICKRDHIEREAAVRRLDSQKKTEALSSRCDFVISNNLNEDPLPGVKKILQTIDIL